jgi:hypothetical protein
MTPREAISRRAFLIKNALSETQRRNETFQVHEERIAADIERLARRIVDDCNRMRGHAPTMWLEDPQREEPALQNSPQQNTRETSETA